MKEDFIQELIWDLKEKITFTQQHPNKPESWCCKKEDYDSEEEYLNALKNASAPGGPVERANKKDREDIQYFEEMIEKVKSLKKNPETEEEKQAWIEVMVELRGDFRHSHSSRNHDLGWGGEVILRCLFDMEEDINE